MKNLKILLIPIGLIALVLGIFSFTNHNGDDDKCTIKIVKIINGKKTVIDSTFDCSEDMNWIESLHANLNGDSIHKMMKVMFMDGDSANCNFKFDFDINENEEDGMKVMKFKGDDGEEVEMKFDFKMTDGEDGTMKMMVNGKEIEIKLDDIHKHLDKLHKDIKMSRENSGDIEIIMNSNDDKENHTIKIIKTVDDKGNVIIKKIVDGKESQISEEDMKKMHQKHQMMFMDENGKINGNHNVSIDVNVEENEGKTSKHVVIITKITSDDEDELTKKNPSTKESLKKKELSIEKLKFSPNPNNGKFDLSFNLDKNSPVKIKIFDIQGKQVYSETISDFNGKYFKNIDISKNGEGVYLLQITQGNKANSSKIVIK